MSSRSFACRLGSGLDLHLGLMIVYKAVTTKLMWHRIVENTVVKHSLRRSQGAEDRDPGICYLFRASAFLNFHHV